MDVCECLLVLYNVEQKNRGLEKAMPGYLESKGIHIQRTRIRNSIHSIRGFTSAAYRIYHRTYSVPSPNSLWHIDGNHTMIKWQLVIQWLYRWLFMVV